MPTLGTVTFGTWKLGAGDPTVIGWVTTAILICAALLCLVYAYLPEPYEGHRAFWGTLGLAVLLLGINKQLDFQWLLHEVVKDMAIRQGWYSWRRVVEMVFSVGLIVAGLFMLTFIRRAIRQTWQQRRLAFIGIVMLVVFIIVRAVYIHEVYELLRLEPPGPWLRTVLECGGALCIAASALLGIAGYRRRRKERVLLARC